LKKAAQQTKYERKFDHKNYQIVKNGRTHLEKSDGEFCDKATFKDEF